MMTGLRVRSRSMTTFTGHSSLSSCKNKRQLCKKSHQSSQQVFKKKLGRSRYLKKRKLPVRGKKLRKLNFGKHSRKMKTSQIPRKWRKWACERKTGVASPVARDEAWFNRCLYEQHQDFAWSESTALSPRQEKQRMDIRRGASALEGSIRVVGQRWEQLSGTRGVHLDGAESGAASCQDGKPVPFPR